MKYKPCPHCGRAKMYLWKSHTTLIKKYHIECYHCNWSGKSMPFIFMARISWNRQLHTAHKPYTGPSRHLHPIDIAYVVTGVICMVIVLVAGYMATIGALCEWTF